MRHGQRGQLGGHLGREPLRRRRAQPGQPRRQLGHARTASAASSAASAAIRSSSPSSSARRDAGLLGPVEHARPGHPRRAAVGPDEPAERGAALLHRGQPGRVGVQRLGVGGQFAGHVGDQVAGLGEPVGQPGQRRVVQRGPARARGRATPSSVTASDASTEAAGRIAEQRLVRGGGRGVQRVGVAPASPPRPAGSRPRPPPGRSPRPRPGRAAASRPRPRAPVPPWSARRARRGPRGAAGRPAGSRRRAACQLRRRANRSSASRCRPGLSSCCWSACPCTATRSSARQLEQRHRHRTAAGEGPGPALGRHRAAQIERGPVVVELAPGLLDLARPPPG